MVTCEIVALRPPMTSSLKIIMIAPAVVASLIVSIPGHLGHMQPVRNLAISKGRELQPKQSGILWWWCSDDDTLIMMMVVTSQPHSTPVRVLLLLLLRHAQGTPLISRTKKATGDPLVSKRLDSRGLFSYLRGSHGLSARRAWWTKSRGP